MLVVRLAETSVSFDAKPDCIDCLAPGPNRHEDDSEKGHISC